MEIDTWVDQPFAALATIRTNRTPHVVPIVFAVVGDFVVTAIDQKAKTTRRLARLTNIKANPAVSLLIDYEADDWSSLWWVRLDGRATITSNPPEDLVQALIDKYPQYLGTPPAGPWIVMKITGRAQWSAS